MTTEFPGADFAVDYASYLSAYELIAQMPLRDWTAGLPLGNGDLCAVAWQPGGAGGFSWGITKTDVWDLRSPYRDYAWTTHAEVLRLIEQEDWEGLRDLRAREQAIAGDRTQPPNFKPCGVLSLRVPEITDHLYLDTDERGRPHSPAGRMVLRGYESRLSLHRAQLTTDLEKRYMRTRTTSFVHATRNVLLVRFRELPVPGYDSPRARRSEYIYDEPQFRSVTLHRHPDPTLGDPVFGCDGQCFWVDYPFPEGVRYVLAVRIIGTGYHTERDDTGWVATLDEPDVPEVTVLASVVTSHESDDPLGAARELVAAAEVAGYDGLAREHQRWWSDFWQRSFVSFSDEFLCHLWHHAIYHHAACSRGRYPPPIQTPWYLNDWQQLHGNYHGDINIQQYTWPVFASNHLELGEPYWRLYSSGLDELRARTRQTYGVDGVRVPVLTTPNMIDHAHLWPRYWMGMSAWHAFIFWEFYRYSQDRSWLQEVGYPVLKGVVEFYRGYLRRDDAGTYHIYPSHSPEQGDLWIRDPTIDLAFIKVALSAAVEAAELLDVDHDLRAAWGEIANHLARYPRNDEVLLDYEGASPDLPLAHVSLLAPIYPVGDLGLDSSPDDYARARRTFEGAVARSNRGVPFFPFDVPTVGDNTNWMWLAAVAARLGLGDTARAYLYDLGISPHLKHNGTFFNGYALHPQQRDDGLAYGHALWAYAGAVNEMLLQSYNGRIRVFPAVPREWTGAFAHMRAVGAFLVTSEYRQGVIPYIVAHSEVGGPCQVVSPWSETQIHDLTTGRKITTTSERLVCWKTEVEHTYRLEPLSAPPRPEKARVIGGRRQLQPRVYWGPTHLANPEERKRAPVYLGKPRQWVPLPPETVYLPPARAGAKPAR